MNIVARLLLAAAAAVLLAPAAQAQDDLAERAYNILKVHCYQCHGVEFKVAKFNVLDHQLLVDEEAELRYLVPGEPESSYLWQRMGIDLDMPPKGIQQRPSEEELATVRQWIAEGAKLYTPGTERPFISEEQLLAAINADLREVSRADRRHQRYFSLVHLHNNNNINDADLRLYRAALSKVVNSLSRQPDIIVPVAIDETQSVFRIDLRDVGWDDLERWRVVLKAYPYGLQWTDGRLDDLTDEINEMFALNNAAPDEIPYLRGDWFVAQATRPPIYETLLQLPATVQELEKELGVNTESDFTRNRLARAGFAGSGISRSNRLIDRHTGTNSQYYYKSFDFGKSFGRAVLFRFPLGPKFESNPFNDQHAFEADGGEIVFSLANGLQGYYITNAVGATLPEAPIKVVRDLNEISGSPVVVNGISCIGCHRTGVQVFEDSVRGAFLGSAEARSKVEELYPEPDEMNKLILRDTRRFVAALEEAIGPFIREGTDDTRPIEIFTEPVTAIARFYDKDISAEEAARELGQDDGAQFALTIQNNRALLNAGLGPLARGDRIPRAMWDAKDESGVSLFQQTAQALGLATPINNQ